jgi:hypothetical protein
VVPVVAGFHGSGLNRSSFLEDGADRTRINLTGSGSRVGFSPRKLERFRAASAAFSTHLPCLRQGLLRYFGLRIAVILFLAFFQEAEMERAES